MLTKALCRLFVPNADDPKDPRTRLAYGRMAGVTGIVCNILLCGGKLLAIDGGFCKAYQKTTGIAGYTLIYNSNNLRLVSHGPFEGINQAVVQNSDIISTTNVLEVKRQRQRVRDTDNGKRLISQIKILKLLLESYRLDGTN